MVYHCEAQIFKRNLSIELDWYSQWRWMIILDTDTFVMQSYDICDNIIITVVTVTKLTT